MRVFSFRNKFSLALNPVIFVVAIAVTVGLLKLGFWQLDRANEKEQRLQRIAMLQHGNRLSIGQLQQSYTSGEDINDLPVKARGTFDNSRYFLQDNQVNEGKVGYRVMKVLTEESTGGHIVVNLGWVPAPVKRTQLPEIDEVSGVIDVIGNSRVPEAGFVLDQVSWSQQHWPMRIQSLDLAKMSQALGVEIQPFIVYEDEKTPLGFVKHWTPIVMPPEKHRAYAVQWFGLAFAWAILMLFAARKSFRTSRSRESRVQSINKKSAPDE